MNDATIVIRPAGADDAGEVSALLRTAWHATYDALYGPDRVAELTARWHAPDRLASEVRQLNTIFLVACDADRIVGMASAREHAPALMLDRLYVLPSEQGRGIGRLLLHAVIDACDGALRVDLEVEPRNAGAIRFYEREGFTVTGSTGDCGGGGDAIPALVMSRRLPA